MGSKRALFVLMTAAALTAGSEMIEADDFELAMVIKSTTNPYYNATLNGAEIAAERDRRHGKELRADAVERPGAGRHHQQPGGPPHSGDRGRAERSRCRRAGDAAAAETRRQGGHLRCRFRHGGRPFFVNQATSNSIGRFGAILLVKAMGGTRRGRWRSCRRSRRPPTRTSGSKRSRTRCPNIRTSRSSTRSTATTTSRRRSTPPSP